MIGSIVRSVRSQLPQAEILVIDDTSTDETAQEAKKAGAEVVSHPYNQGNGAAVKTGIRRAKGQLLVLMDGDGQHRPEDLQKLLEHCPQYDMVVAAREEGSHANWYRRLANIIYNCLASYVANRNILDLTSGYRVIKTGLARQFVYLLPNQFSYPTTLTLSLIKAGYHVKYVPTTFNKRVGKSKIRIYRDGIRFFLIIIKIATLFSPMRIFIPTSIGFFGLGISYYAYTFVTEHRFTNMSLLLLVTGVILFMMGLIAEQVAMLRLERSEEN